MGSKSQRRWIGVLLLFLSAVLFVDISGAESRPRKNHGVKWRIGYYEGGGYSDYVDTMRTMVEGLIELGWINALSLPELHGEVEKPYWDWLCRCGSPYLSFEKKDGYSAGWDENQRAQKRESLLRKLKKGRLDLVIAMGTWAGQDLANDTHQVPVMVLSTSNPIEAGIIKSAQDSGYNHVTARLDPNRYLRQLRMFHRIVRFNKLGVAFEDTPEGRIYAAVKEIQQVSRERGFQVVFCEVIDSNTDIQTSDQSCLNCYRELAHKVDAVYVTALACVDRQVKEVAEIFKTNRITSFSMVGSKYVKEGIMLSISSDSGYAELGRYNADKFGKILNGTKPSSLLQIFEDPLDIAVNRKTTNQVGFSIPKSIIKIATEIYDE